MTEEIRIGICTEDDETICETCGDNINAGEVLFWNVNVDDENSVMYGNNDPRIETSLEFFDADPPAAATCAKCVGGKQKR